MHALQSPAEARGCVFLDEEGNKMILLREGMQVMKLPNTRTCLCRSLWRCVLKIRSARASRRMTCRGSVLLHSGHGADLGAHNAILL